MVVCQQAQYNSGTMIATLLRFRPFVVPFTMAVALTGQPIYAATNGVTTGQTLSRQADALVKQGRELEAAQRYLAAHVQFQQAIMGYFESALRQSLSEQGTPSDEDDVMRAGSLVSDLRNVNLSKLWIVLDPDDRARQQGLESERATLLQQFDRFIREDSAADLEDFLYRLYPEDESGERQMEAVRQGHMPPSKRWERLQLTLSP